MTGDETNKHDHIFNHELKEPVASKSGEESELKPCPFCGRTITLLERSSFSYQFVVCGKCFDDEPYNSELTKEEWNNAWAHKQIAALEARNAELENVLKTTDPLYEERLKILTFRDEKIADLEKRNAEWIEDRDRWIERYKKLQGELKTAEDALAASQKECLEQARLNGMGASREGKLIGKLERLERELAAVTREMDYYKESLYEERDSH